MSAPSPPYATFNPAKEAHHWEEDQRRFGGDRRLTALLSNDCYQTVLKSPINDDELYSYNYWIVALTKSVAHFMADDRHTKFIWRIGHLFGAISPLETNKEHFDLDNLRALFIAFGQCTSSIHPVDVLYINAHVMDLLAQGTHILTETPEEEIFIRYYSKTATAFLENVARRLSLAQACAIGHTADGASRLREGITKFALLVPHGVDRRDLLELVFLIRGTPLDSSGLTALRPLLAHAASLRAEDQGCGDLSFQVVLLSVLALMKLSAREDIDTVLQFFLHVNARADQEPLPLTCSYVRTFMVDFLPTHVHLLPAEHWCHSEKMYLGQRAIVESFDLNTCNHCDSKALVDSVFADQSIRPLLRCTRCCTAYYCNESCQRRDWKNHKAVCNVFRDSEHSPTELRETISRGAAPRALAPLPLVDLIPLLLGAEPPIF